MCCARKTAVGQKCNAVAQAGANQRRCNREHLAHSRAAFGPLIANYHDVSGLNAAVLHRLERGFFAIENASSTAEVLYVMTRDFHHAAFRSEIAFQDYQTPGGLERRVQL